MIKNKPTMIIEQFHENGEVINNTFQFLGKDSYSFPREVKTIFNVYFKDKRSFFQKLFGRKAYLKMMNQKSIAISIFKEDERI